MSSALTKDSSLNYKLSFKTVEGILDKVAVQPLCKLENALKHILSFVTESKESAGSTLKEEKENGANLSKMLSSIMSRLDAIEKKIAALESGSVNKGSEFVAKTNDVSKKDDEFDLFGSDNEVELSETKKKVEEKVKEKKKIPKSALIIDIKPLDDHTDLALLEEKVRGIEMDGLEWKGSEHRPLAFGIKVLRISCVIEDAKISTYDLEDRVSAFDDLSQGMDIVSFNVAS